MFKHLINIHTQILVEKSCTGFVITAVLGMPNICYSQYQKMEKTLLD